MIIVAALLGFLSSSARAEDSIVAMPLGGVSFVLGNDCAVKVVGHVPAAKASTVLDAGSRVAGRCLADKAALASQVRKDKQAEARSTSEDKLIDKLDQKDGGFEYVSDLGSDGSSHTRILGGQTAVAAQFVGRLGGFDPSMMALNSNDPSMVLSNVATTAATNRGGGTLYLYPTTAATPDAATTIPVADGSALSACQQGLKTATGVLAECRGAK